MKIFISLILLSVASLSYADTLGFRVSGGLWSYEVTGDIRDSADVNDNFNLKTDLGMKDTEEFQGFVYFEHPVPIIPNVRLGVTSFTCRLNDFKRRFVSYRNRSVLRNYRYWF